VKSRRQAPYTTIASFVSHFGKVLDSLNIHSLDGSARIWLDIETTFGHIRST
jgi:hypothetical protein